MNDGWNEDCRYPSTSARKHWREWFQQEKDMLNQKVIKAGGVPDENLMSDRLEGEWRERGDDWEPVYGFVTQHCSKGRADEFKVDIHFAVWGFRNDYAQEQLRRKLIKTDIEEEKNHKKVCADALHALDKLAGLGEIFRGESAPLRHALKTFIGRLGENETNKRNGGNPTESKRGPKTKYAVSRLIRTLENRWAHFVGDKVMIETWISFVYAVMKASGYPERGNVDTIIRTAKKRTFTPPIAPVADLEFIHPVDADLLLYLRNAPNALKVYEIGPKFLFIHRGEAKEGDTTLGQMFYVDWEN